MTGHRTTDVQLRTLMSNEEATTHRADVPKTCTMRRPAKQRWASENIQDVSHPMRRSNYRNM